MKIGIVEDNQSVRDMLAVGFQLSGHEATGYGTGVEALEAIVEAQPPLDVLLVDIMLPGDMSGLDLVETLRHVAPAADLKIIFVTGNDLAQRLIATRNLSDVPLIMKGAPRIVNKILAMIENPSPSIARIHG